MINDITLVTAGGIAEVTNCSNVGRYQMMPPEKRPDVDERLVKVIKQIQATGRGPFCSVKFCHCKWLLFGYQSLLFALSMWG